MDTNALKGALSHAASPAIRGEWNQICNNLAARETAWIASLRAEGITAAHPDDGWVDRRANQLLLTNPLLTNPQFNDRLTIGSRLALGWPDRHRVVRITGIRAAMFGLRYWQFAED